MSYLSIHRMSVDPTLRARVAACAAQEGADNPEGWAYQNALRWAASPGWAAAWEYALAAGIEDPGADAGVITDGSILAAVQPMLKPPAEPEVEVPVDPEPPA